MEKYVKYITKLTVWEQDYNSVLLWFYGIYVN